MKTKLLRKLRKRFRFTVIHGTSELIDMSTRNVYNKWRYPYTEDHSILDQNVAIAIKILTGKDRWNEIERKKFKRDKARYMRDVARVWEELNKSN